MTDLVGAHPDAQGHAAVAAAHTITDLLRVDANDVDAGGVTRARVDLVAGAGLLGLAGAQALGGGDAPAAVVREVAELLAGACGATWFVLTQHRSVMEAAARTANQGLRDLWAAPLASGDALGAVSFAHLRRPGPPTVRASAVDGGWRFDGPLDWVTSWGLADVLLLMAESADGEVVQTLLPMPREAVAGEFRQGMTVLGPVPLAAMDGTRTVALRLEDAFVPDAEVSAVFTKEAWTAEDSTRTPNAPPNAFGLARSVVGALDDLGTRRSDPQVTDLARVLAEEVRTVRSAAYLLVDDVDPSERTEDRLELRAHSHELALRAAAAYVTAASGGALRRDHDGQRWMREAMFHLVQAQTPRTRAAYLAL